MCVCVCVCVCVREEGWRAKMAIVKKEHHLLEADITQCSVALTKIIGNRCFLNCERHDEVSPAESQERKTQCHYATVFHL